MTTSKLTPDDLIDAAALCRAALEPALDRDWEIPARDMIWSCRRTLDHIVDVMFFYAANLATASTSRRPPPRNGDLQASPAELLTAIQSGAAIFAAVCRAAPAGTRGFHPAGMADVEGFVAMGCEEIILHTDDIAAELGGDFAPPDAFTRRIAARLFPWAPVDSAPWDALRWAAGRIALPDRERLGPDWYWHCAPLAEWDGSIKKRTAPPAWR